MLSYYNVKRQNLVEEGKPRLKGQGDCQVHASNVVAHGIPKGAWPLAGAYSFPSE